MENNTKFKEGDVVQLNSGGAWMVVIEIDGEKVYCQWFKKNGDLDGGVFKFYTLRKVLQEEKQDEDDNFD